MGRKGVSVCLVMVLILSSIVVLDVSMDISPHVEAITIYVDDDYGSEDATHKMTIQAAVDAANPGDTVYVYSGIYYEGVIIDKTINLTGEDRDTTTIHTTGTNIGIFVEYVDYVNISGFTVENGSSGGIRFIPSNNSIIESCRFEKNGDGLEIVFSNYTIIRNNIVINNSGSGNNGIHIMDSTNMIIRNNTCINNSNGILLHPNNNNNWIIGNNCSGNGDGIYLSSGSNFNNYIGYNNISSNLNYGIADFSGNNNIYVNNTIKNCNRGFSVYPIDNVQIINSSIENSSTYDIRVSFSNTILTSINTKFNKSKVVFDSITSKLIVQWYLHINVTNSLGQQMPNVNVCIKDNQNSLPAKRYTTDSEGYIRWLTQTEYIEQDTNGDTVGEKTYYTPHRITAWNETLMGYDEVNINESKEVNIVLDTPYYEIPLSAGWNLISLPLVQSDTIISTVLSSIAGNWDVVWWYNASDGTWHSTNDDLTDINHTMGFWIHMKTADTLIVNGSIPNNTFIQLYQGWNLIGNPSFCNHAIDDILSPIATKYVAVQQYDSWDSGDPWKHYNINKPPGFNDLAYMTSGRGYWLYVKEDVVWEVSNF